MSPVDTGHGVQGDPATPKDRGHETAGVGTLSRARSAVAIVDAPCADLETEKERRRGWIRLSVMGARHYRIGESVCIQAEHERRPGNVRGSARWWRVHAVSHARGEIVLRPLGPLRTLVRATRDRTRRLWRWLVEWPSWARVALRTWRDRRRWARAVEIERKAMAARKALAERKAKP